MMVNQFGPQARTDSPAYLCGALTSLKDDVLKRVASDRLPTAQMLDHARSWLRWIDDNRAGIASALESAYLALLRSGEYRVQTQRELSALRDAIAAATGRSEQDVQDEFEARAAGLRQEGEHPR